MMSYLPIVGPVAPAVSVSTMLEQVVINFQHFATLFDFLSYRMAANYAPGAFVITMCRSLPLAGGLQLTV